MFVRRILVRWLCKPRVRCCTTPHDRPPSTHAHICAPTMPRGVRRTALASSGASGLRTPPAAAPLPNPNDGKVDGRRQTSVPTLCVHSLPVGHSGRASAQSLSAIGNGGLFAALRQDELKRGCLGHAVLRELEHKLTATPSQAKPLQRANAQTRGRAAHLQRPRAPNPDRWSARECVRVCVCLRAHRHRRPLVGALESVHMRVLRRQHRQSAVGVWLYGATIMAGGMQHTRECGLCAARRRQYAFAEKRCHSDECSGQWECRMQSARSAPTTRARRTGSDAKTASRAAVSDDY